MCSHIRDKVTIRLGTDFTLREQNWRQCCKNESLYVSQMGKKQSIAVTRLEVKLFLFSLPLPKKEENESWFCWKDAVFTKQANNSALHPHSSGESAADITRSFLLKSCRLQYVSDINTLRVLPSVVNTSSIQAKRHLKFF